MKLSELIKLGEKKEAKYIDAPEALQYNNESYLKTEGYNLARDEDNNMEIEVDEEAIKKILIAENKTGSHILNNYPNQFSTVLVNEAAHAIASQLPKFLKGK